MMVKNLAFLFDGYDEFPQDSDRQYSEPWNTIQLQYGSFFPPSHGKPKMIQELSHFLDHHLNINSLCLVPFNMTILIFLYKAGVVLPKTSAHLYEHFIYKTICSNLAKSGHCLKNTSPNLEKLPKPCNGINKQLSIFHYSA